MQMDKDKVADRLTREEIEVVVSEHQRYGYRLAWNFLKGWHVRLHPDEVTSIVGMALVEAARRFDPSMNVAFKTFFFYHLKGMLLREISRLVNESKVNLSLFASQSTSGIQDSQSVDEASWFYVDVDRRNPEQLMQDEELAAICRKACAELDPLEREILHRHFVNDEPLKDIAKELKYNRCHISRVKSIALAKLQSIMRDLLPSELREGIGENDNQCESQDYDSGKLDESVKATSGKMVYTGGRGRRKS